MPDATEWLVEYLDSESETRYERIADRDDAIEYLRQLVGQGKVAFLYQRVDFEVQIGVTVKSPRRRRKKEAKEGAASPQAAEDGRQNSGAAQPVHDQAATAGAETFASLSPASPVFDCEARFDGDPACPGPAAFDPISRGHFCLVHVAIPEGHRVELHRRHASRNRPVRVAHAG